ncbi:MAG: 23S rRNA pseudouridine(1911/1915/1917) synthase RluD [Gammaproteobacteria bacterium]|nr:23S rRNA pseudouridine(1911/1915/1917) synthase RluD [Gammaproteobacteria bacterium]
MTESVTDKPIIKRVSERFAGQRLDAALASMFPDYSRSRLQRWIRDGRILLDGEPAKPRTRLVGDELLELTIRSESPPDEYKAQAISLNIVFEDESIIVLDKAAGLVVHPAVGHADGTLVNALLHHDANLSQVPRAGIVHRLDKETTGLMVVARNLRAHKHLVAELQQRNITREYQAIVQGIITAGGIVDVPIGRHSRDRVRMCVREDGKPAKTHYRVITRFRDHTLVQLQLESGRTHQIRVHMQYIRHAIVGDPVYGGRPRIPPQANPALIDQLRYFKRQALHAFRLTLLHPETGEALSWCSALPNDMKQLLAALQLDLEKHGT